MVYKEQPVTAFYILKPDMFEDKAALEFYQEFLKNEGIKPSEKFRAEWIGLSKLLYEPVNINSAEELRKIRKQLLTTIKAYQMLYPDFCAIDIFDTRIGELQKLYDFKKILRRKFVFNTDRYYIRFDGALPLDSKLADIDISGISCSVVIKKSDEELTDSGYNMAFLNKIHFPDSNEESLSHDMEIIRNFDKRLIRR